jgi:hypothetical protein
MGPKLIINGQINKLRRMQNFPKYYLYKYFDDLKRRVDLLHEPVYRNNNKCRDV